MPAAAKRHAAEANASARQVLASSAVAFRRTAEAHERVASLYETRAAIRTGDGRERQAALHRAAAATARQRAEYVESLLSEPGQAGGLRLVSDEPGDDVAL